MTEDSPSSAPLETASRPASRWGRIGRIVLLVLFALLLIVADLLFGPLDLPLVVGLVLFNIVFPLATVAILAWVFYKVFLRQMLRDRKARLLRFNRHRMRAGL
jgi:hypothetical protein